MFYHFIYYLKRSVITTFIIVNIKIYYQKSHRALLVDCRIATECCCGVTPVFYTSTNRCTVLLKVYTSTCLLLWRIRLGGPLMRARSQNMKLKKKNLKSDFYSFSVMFEFWIGEKWLSMIRLFLIKKRGFLIFAILKLM